MTTSSVRYPFPSKESRRYRKNDLGPPVVPGGQEIGLDPETSAPGRRHVPRGAPSLRSGWVIGTDRRMSEHPCAFDREKDFRTETKQWMHAEEGGGMERKEDY